MEPDGEDMDLTGDSVANRKTERSRHPYSPSKTKRGLRLSDKGDRSDVRELKKGATMFRSNARHAVSIWGELPKITMRSLKELTDRHALSIVAGDLQLLSGRWYVTHSGLLRMAKRSRCSAITTSIDRIASDP